VSWAIKCVHILWNAWLPEGVRQEMKKSVGGHSSRNRCTGNELPTVMQPVLHWASNLLILGFSAGSCMSAKHIGSCSHTLASLSHASVAFQQFSLTSASAIHKISNCLSLAPGRTSKNHSKASRAMQQQVTCGLAKQWMQIG
jgi:hypothetical protein